MHTFHFIVSTVGRPEALTRLIASLERQTETYFLTVVEQSPHRACEQLLSPLIATGNAEYVHEPLVRGLSRGRNEGLRDVRGAIIAFPDDDCWYPDGLLSQVAAELDSDGCDGISTLLTDASGDAALLRWSSDAQQIRPETIARTVSSATLFLKAKLVRAVGDFDPDLGSGSGTPFGAGEETDYVLRALASGARIRYVPHLEVNHAEWRSAGEPDEVRAKVRRYNRGFGRVLRKHHRNREFTYWTGRSLAGFAYRVATADPAGAVHQLDQLIGRVQGFCARPPRTWAR
jgi:GT2 family glycosyltransferase